MTGLAELGAVRAHGRLACILPPRADLGQRAPPNVTLHRIFLERERRRLGEMRPLFERGVVRPLVDEILPLEEVGRAHERLDSGHGKGKVGLSAAA